MLKLLERDGPIAGRAVAPTLTVLRRNDLEPPGGAMSPVTEAADAAVASVLRRVRARMRAWSASGDERATSWSAWLERTVVRPLVGGGVVDAARLDVPEVPEQRRMVGSAEAAGMCLDLAVELAEAAARDARPEVLEACAGALRLLTLTDASTATGDDSSARRARLLAALDVLAAVPAGRVTVSHDGPYLAAGPGVTAMVDWLGQRLDPPPVVALCRCGASAAKPWCDGSHADTGFSGATRDDRVPDRLDTYPARQFEITDNRGLCAHSARCTDGLPTVFRAGEEPFVAPAGGRADDILRAVQACPSGALGAMLEGRRAAALVDSDREPSIEVSRDGPYRLTGGIAVVDAEGRPEPRPVGYSPEHASLCRCGHSTNKPFCSGAHWHADFHDPVPGDDPTLFAWAGGYPALLRTTRLFYERHVADDDLLAPLFARMEPDHPERVASWLSEVFGGPELYSQRYGGYARMISQHIGKHLTEAQRSRWITLLVRSADEAGLPSDPEFRAAFAGYLEWGTRIAVENSTEGAAPPEGMPVPRWWWVCDATPAARPSALPGAEPQDVPEVSTPADDEPVGFAAHVRGLFRPRDRGSMRFVFDLWECDDVAEHADEILGRLRDGSMPCDGPWPEDRVAVFARWIDDGRRP
ncbi:CDGSH iron-sulfur domain-containing protein [Pseudonocardia nematodicida]|uniref:CDGSH iron-sulfur domain-containing protein n=1 Tax=Pseudonocardia nematodicida TaxID=1206997 RepID=A0ABV1K5B0_9PSEU